MTLANYAMKLEREVWGVLEGPWGGDTWMGWRRNWAQKVSASAKPYPYPFLTPRLLCPSVLFGTFYCQHLRCSLCELTSQACIVAAHLLVVACSWLQ